MTASPSSAPPLRLHAPAPANLRLHDPDAEDLKDDAHDRLLRLVEHDHNTGCWVYTGPWQRDGNGVLRVGGRQYVASRVAAWVYQGGFALDDRTVRVEHVCRGTPACVCPGHLVVVRRPAAQMKRAA